MLRGLDNVTDEQLIEIIQQGEPKEARKAQEILYEKYYPTIKKDASKILRRDKAFQSDDIAQDVFIKFVQRMKTGELHVTNVEAYLRKMAYNQSVDTLRRWKIEDSFEKNKPLKVLKEPEDPLRALIMQENSQEQLRWLYHLPFATGLSDCPRIVWLLQWIYKYPPSVIARLLSKERGTIDTHFSKANTLVHEYTHNDMYEIDFPIYLQNQGTSRLISPNIQSLIERFATPIIPQLTLDELKPLNLSEDEFRGYAASLILPGPGEYTRWLANRRLYLLLTKLSDWQKMRSIFNSQNNNSLTITDDNQSEINNASRPQEALFRIDVEEDYIHLTPLSLVWCEHNFIPENEDKLSSYLAATSFEEYAYVMEQKSVNGGLTRLSFHNHKKNKYIPGGLMYKLYGKNDYYGGEEIAIPRVIETHVTRSEDLYKKYSEGDCKYWLKYGT